MAPLFGRHRQLAQFLVLPRQASVSDRHGEYLIAMAKLLRVYLIVARAHLECARSARGTDKSSDKSEQDIIRLCYQHLDT